MVLHPRSILRASLLILKTALDMLKVSLKQPWPILEPSLNLPWILPEPTLKHNWHIHEASSKHPWIIVEAFGRMEKWMDGRKNRWTDTLSDRGYYLRWFRSLWITSQAYFPHLPLWTPLKPLPLPSPLSFTPPTHPRIAVSKSKVAKLGTLEKIWKQICCS